MSDRIHYGWKNASPSCSHEYLLPAVGKLIPKGRFDIIDLGCGNGFIAGKLAESGHGIVGVDASEDGIRIAQKTYSDARFEIRSIYDSFSDLKEKFDLAISLEVIEHLYRPQELVKRAFEVLKENGFFIVTTPFHGYWKNLALSLFNKWDDHHTPLWEGGHIKFFSEKTLSDLLRKNGFSNIKFNNCGRFPFLWKSMVCMAQKVASEK